MSHTKGPWRIGKNYGAVVADHAIEGGVSGTDCVEAYGGHLVGESIAKCNASLIAAAPELLFELKSCAELIESLSPVNEIADLFRRAGLQHVRAVIAKAEGK